MINFQHVHYIIINAQHAGIIHKVPAVSHSDYGFAGKEATQASAPIGANLLLAYGSTGSPKLSLFEDSLPGIAAPVPCN
jgi:hypothetical protein